MNTYEGAEMAQRECISETIAVYYEKQPSYDIMLEKDYGRLVEAIDKLGMRGRRFMIVTDSNVAAYYLKECQALLASLSDCVVSYIMPAGEASKNLNTVQECYSRLISAGFDRNDVLVALGGGVVGDLTGYTAATYLRGIRFLQLPTSLLAMVDSSIGGKTGVDYQAYKNMVGAFHQPKLVYISLSALLSLPDREFASGMSEIIKHGLIKDQNYYEWLKANREGIRQKKLELLQEMIKVSCLIKKAVVEKDPKELGDRALLNFGHTIGHAIEKLKDFSLLHGECVSLGMNAAAYLSYQRGHLTRDEYEDILNTLKAFDLPIKPEGLEAEEVYKVSRSDKKMDGNKIRFILLKSIGEAIIDPSVSKDELLEAISYIIR